MVRLFIGAPIGSRVSDPHCEHGVRLVTRESTCVLVVQLVFAWRPSLYMVTHTASIAGTY